MLHRRNGMLCHSFASTQKIDHSLKLHPEREFRRLEMKADLNHSHPSHAYDHNHHDCQQMGPCSKGSSQKTENKAR
jgi:hypothetical protein